MKHIIMLLIATLILIPTPGFAFTNQVAGFREMNWGDSPEKLIGIYGEDKVSVDEKAAYFHDTINGVKTNISSYKVITDTPYVSGIKIDKTINYTFFGEELYAISFNVTYKSRKLQLENSKKMYSNMVLLYGEPDERYNEKDWGNKEYTAITWYGTGDNNEVEISLSIYSGLTREREREYYFSVSLIYMPIINRLREYVDEQKLEQAKEGW